MNTWLEDNIESGIRNEVKLLRDNGFNTECSCHHNMHIQCHLGLLDGELERLHALLANNGYQNYTILAEVRVQSGFIHSYLDVSFDDKEKIVRQELPVESPLSTEMQ